jgi:hypothetical protein
MTATTEAGSMADIPPGRIPDSEKECTYCGALYHKRCMHCHRAGEPYTYHGIEFDGLTAYKGEKLCPGCRDAIMAVEGVNIHVVGRGGIDHVYNSVRDADLVTPIAAAYRYADWNSEQMRATRRQLRKHKS